MEQRSCRPSEGTRLCKSPGHGASTQSSSSFWLGASLDTAPFYSLRTGFCGVAGGTGTLTKPGSRGRSTTDAA